MTDRAWKAFERTIAKRVGGKRLPCDGSKDGADVDAGPFVYQCKLGRRMPSYIRDWLRGIVAAGERKGAVGVMVWKVPGARVDDSVVVLRLRDWADLHGPPDKEKPALTRTNQEIASAGETHRRMDRRENQI